MDCRRFLKTLSALPLLSFPPRRKGQAHPRVLLLETPVVGFRYNDGAELLPQLVPGQTLQLVRESHNRHDAKAIAVRHARGKLDYIPRVDNTVPANLLDQNRKLNAIINARHDPTTCWNPLEVAVWMEG